VKRGGEVLFKRGDLVQVYTSTWDYTFSNTRRLIYRWSMHHRVTQCIFHSYRLETLGGVAMDGLYNVHRLRAFTPKRGGILERVQREFIAQLAPVLEEDECEEQEAVEIECAEAVGAGLE
jgi:hypothetical protein